MKIINIICKHSQFNSDEIVLSAKVRLNSKTSTYKYTLNKDKVFSKGLIEALSQLAIDKALRTNNLLVIETIIAILQAKREKDG